MAKCHYIVDSAFLRPSSSPQCPPSHETGLVIAFASGPIAQDMFRSSITHAV